MATRREHIEETRRLKFSIGGEPYRRTEDLHQAVKNLSAELYAKDVHFLMELIQIPIIRPLVCKAAREEMFFYNGCITRGLVGHGLIIGLHPMSLWFRGK